MFLREEQQLAEVGETTDLVLGRGLGLSVERILCASITGHKLEYYFPISLFIKSIWLAETFWFGCDPHPAAYQMLHIKQNEEFRFFTVNKAGWQKSCSLGFLFVKFSRMFPCFPAPPSTTESSAVNHAARLAVCHRMCEGRNIVCSSVSMVTIAFGYICSQLM